MTSLADFDMNSTSRKHKNNKYVRYSFLPHHKWGNYHFFIHINKKTQTFFSKIIERMLSFELLV